MIDARRGVDGGFNDAGDAGVDYVRVRTAQGGVNHNHREINRRNTVDADALIRDEAE